MTDALTRDLADVAGDVGDIAVGIKHAGKWLGDAYADGATEKIRPAIRELYRARAALNKLIGELEADFAEPLGGVSGPQKCPSCKREFKNGATCHMGGCPMGGDF